MAVVNIVLNLLGDVIISQPCEDCESPVANFGPCPFASEINDDDTPVWLCNDCAYERAQDI